SRNGVRHPHELGAERPQLDRSALGVDLPQLRRAEQAVLVQLRLDQPERQPGRPDLLDANLSEQVRQRADVILVRVREHDCPDRALAPLQVREVRQDQIDAEMLVAREREATVDNDRVAAELIHGHVLPDLAEAAEGDYPAPFRHRCSLWPTAAESLSRDAASSPGAIVGSWQGRRECPYR